MKIRETSLGLVRERDVIMENWSDATLLVLKMEEVAMNLGFQAVSRSWKRQETDSPPGGLREAHSPTTPCNCPSETDFGLLTSQTIR